MLHACRHHACAPSASRVEFHQRHGHSAGTPSLSRDMKRKRERHGGSTTSRASPTHVLVIAAAALQSIAASGCVEDKTRFDCSKEAQRAFTKSEQIYMKTVDRLARRACLPTLPQIRKLHQERWALHRHQEYCKFPFPIYLSVAGSRLLRLERARRSNPRAPPCK